MTLDQMEKVARGLVKYGISVDAKKAAEMLLLLIPVVKAAERMRNAGQVCDAMTAGDPDRGRKRAAYSDGCFAVERAIDTMRAALAKETR